MATKSATDRQQTSNIFLVFASIWLNLTILVGFWDWFKYFAVLIYGHIAVFIAYILLIWDALILAAARASGASEIYTEDFNHGQDYGGIRAINPFR